MDDDVKIKELMDKISEVQDSQKFDLSSDEDLSIAIMNLISIEEHLFFTAQKTENSKYLDLLNEVREMRKGLLKKIVKNPEGEIWCISKHLLAGTMRLEEVGTKALGKGNKEEATELFKKAYQLYSLFWGLNLKLINVDDIKAKEDDDDIDEDAIKDESEEKISSNNNGKKLNFLESLGKALAKALDCCKE
ncbi:MAG: hypothetical protein NTX26_02325 [Candidatus Parcubacteria bacterium]|nr:hypothetical protein [Candidatus Parcubacteria bacterium]